MKTSDSTLENANSECESSNCVSIKSLAVYMFELRILGFSDSRILGFTDSWIHGFLRLLSQGFSWNTNFFCIALPQPSLHTSTSVCNIYMITHEYMQIHILKHQYRGTPSLAHSPSPQPTAQAEPETPFIPSPPRDATRLLGYFQIRNAIFDDFCRLSKKERRLDAPGGRK